jgi:hypothetical protein
MSRDLPIGDTFGNYLIHGISEIGHPDPISWTPEAPGWMAVFSIFLFIVAWVIFRGFRRWHRNAYRRAALSAIKKIQEKEVNNTKAVLSALPRILKDTALLAYPRTTVASLTGNKWIQFLESRYPAGKFNPVLFGHLITIAYQPPEKWGFTEKEAIDTVLLVKNWIRLHDRKGQNA